MISPDVDVMCPWCGVTSKLGDWNKLTFSRCINREMKRSYTDLYKKKAFLSTTPAYYLCPNCGMWPKGSQLKIVNTDDPELKKLGGEPIIKPHNKNDT